MANLIANSNSLATKIIYKSKTRLLKEQNLDLLGHISVLQQYEDKLFALMSTMFSREGNPVSDEERLNMIKDEVYLTFLQYLKLMAIPQEIERISNVIRKMTEIINIKIQGLLLPELIKKEITVETVIESFDYFSSRLTLLSVLLNNQFVRRNYILVEKILSLSAISTYILPQKGLNEISGLVTQYLKKEKLVFNNRTFKKAVSFMKNNCNNEFKEITIAKSAELLSEFMNEITAEYISKWCNSKSEKLKEFVQKIIENTNIFLGSCTQIFGEEYISIFEVSLNEKLIEFGCNCILSSINPHNEATNYLDIVGLLSENISKKNLVKQRLSKYVFAKFSNQSKQKMLEDSFFPMQNNMTEGIKSFGHLVECFVILNQLVHKGFEGIRHEQNYKAAFLDILSVFKSKEKISLLLSLYIHDCILRASRMALSELKLAISTAVKLIPFIDEFDMSIIEKFFITRVGLGKITTTEIEAHLLDELKSKLGIRLTFNFGRLISQFSESKNVYSKIKMNKPEPWEFSYSLFSAYSLYSSNKIEKSADIIGQYACKDVSQLTQNCMNIYQIDYPHRKINVCQALSYCELKYLKTGLIMVCNSIMANILLMFRYDTNKKLSIVLEDLKVLTIHASDFRFYLLFLINQNILKCSTAELTNDSELTINSETFEKDQSKKIWRILNSHQQIINSMNQEKEDTAKASTNEIMEEPSSSNTQNQNINYILDCYIIKILKSNTQLEQHAVVKEMLQLSKQLKLAGVDFSKIQSRIESLNERDLISQEIIENGVVLKYSSL